MIFCRKNVPSLDATVFKSISIFMISSVGVERLGIKLEMGRVDRLVGSIATPHTPVQVVAKRCYGMCIVV